MPSTDGDVAAVTRTSGRAKVVSFPTALVVMAVVVVGSAMACGLAIAVTEVRIRRAQVRRNAEPDAEDDWQEVVRGVVVRD